MNSHSSAHEIPKVPNLYIDAFRGKYLAKTADSRNTFILTHYHGDHYGSLARDGNYTGPARIHCTGTTARLLTRIHGVPEEFVVAHSYGATWTLPVDESTTPINNNNEQQQPQVRITFYDANHCPGAAIVVIELPDGAVHVHTGDFRYHERMQHYDLPRTAALQRRIESILLDTTYAHPKHDFASQNIVVEAIAQQVRDKVDGETLILLECYNIGKEKILWATANACQQPMYVSDRKWKLLECLAANEQHGGDAATDESAWDCHHELIQKCTRDAQQTDIHIVPMSTSGEMWPFFQPNYESIAEYVELQQHKRYRKVISFIPTGWAEATNWNKKHAATKMVRRGLDIEIRLVAYSEHSSFAELQEFVKFTKPMRVIATVYKDENDKRNIEARFQVDRTRAKKRFLEQITRQSSLSVTDASVTAFKSVRVSPSAVEKRQVIEIDCEATDESSGSKEKLTQLISMGFSKDDAQKALVSTGHDLEAAINSLLQGGLNMERTPIKPKPLVAATSTLMSSSSKSPKKLTAFFKRKEK